MNRIIAIAIVALLAVGGGLAYFHYSDANSTVVQEVTVSEPDTSVLVEGLISDFISVNNPDWGRIQVMENSYTGRTVTYEGIPSDGCSFVAWLDSKGNYIETSNTIESSRLDTKGTTAVFIDSISGNNTAVSYSWRMPTFNTDINGEMTYRDMTYYGEISESDFNMYKSMDVHRKAVLGNVYLTPWELVADDPAVQDVVQYLEPYVDGLTNMQKAWVVMCFVQDAITYQTDSGQYGVSEYWAYPIETLYSGKGDCEDTAILFCALGSKLGLDTGLVSFSYNDTERRSLGHMGAAVALVGTENVTADNDPLFTIGDSPTYCYVETACDSRFELGYLLKYPDLDAYRIYDGGFTHITYDPIDGFGHDVLVAIGTNYDTSSIPVYSSEQDADVYYGDDFTNPPTLNMAVGDLFSYIPETNLPCVFSASGNGLVENGGPFTFNPETNELSGKVVKKGSYQVIIKAETVEPLPYQVAYQYIQFVVGDSGIPDYGGQVKSLSFVNGSWNMISQDIEYNNETVDSEDNGIDRKYIIAGVGIAILAGLVIVRRFV